MNRLGVAGGRQVKSVHAESQGADTHTPIMKIEKVPIIPFTPAMTEDYTYTLIALLLSQLHL